MDIQRIEHIGIAVKNIDAARKFYEGVLGLTCYGVEEIPDQKTRTAFFVVGGTKIELLESTSADGPVGKFIEKRGEGIHHLAFAIQNVDHALQEAEGAGIQLIDQQSRTGAEGLRIGFLHPKSSGGVLVELCSEPER